jgi:hypothetical protein
MFRWSSHHQQGAPNVTGFVLHLKSYNITILHLKSRSITVLYDFRCRTEPVTFGSPWWWRLDFRNMKHVEVILIQIHNCKQCLYLLVCLNNREDILCLCVNASLLDSTVIWTSKAMWKNTVKNIYPAFDWNVSVTAVWIGTDCKSVPHNTCSICIR